MNEYDSVPAGSGPVQLYCVGVNVTIVDVAVQLTFSISAFAAGGEVLVMARIVAVRPIRRNVDCDADPGRARGNRLLEGRRWLPERSISANDALTLAA
jgi:hypothetical protein